MYKTVTTTIDEALCTGCGLCVEVCPKETITMDGTKAAVTGRESLNCGHCMAVCPTGAITVAALDPALSSFKNFEIPEAWLPFGHGDIRGLVNLMQSRRSCRDFREKPVPPDVLEDLVKIGITAPSGSNCQQWSFTIVPDRPAVEKLARWIGDFYANLNRTAEKIWLRKGLKLLGKPELSRYFRNHYQTVREGLEAWERGGRDMLFHGASAAVVVGSKKEASCPGEDALLATQNILLAAHVLGLGTCLIGFAVEAMRRDRSILRRIGIPGDESAHAVIALGYPKEAYQRVTGRRQVLMRYFSGGQSPAAR
jgi:nitroreductase/NAD-dependent dihydropyrimidine dehydrogenase PreA subunit